MGLSLLVSTLNKAKYHAGAAAELTGRLKKTFKIQKLIKSSVVILVLAVKTKRMWRKERRELIQNIYQDF